METTQQVPDILDCVSDSGMTGKVIDLWVVA